MRWRIHWEQAAVESLLELASKDLKVARRLTITAASFGRGGRVDAKKLQGQQNAWRIRVGDWRLLMTLDGNDAIVDSIDKRRDAY